MSQPLASIVMNGGAGLRWLAHAPADLGETRTSLERIVREGTRAGEVIQRMRSLALRPSPRTEPFQLNDAIAEMVALMRSELSNQRIAVRLELAPALPRVVGDRVQVAQVVLNLLVNAIEAMTELTDRPRELTVTTQLAQTGRVVVRVADCGGGIAADVIDRIFDPFVTTKDGAMGLGLSISRTIVERHDGRIWAATDQRRGATLCFTLATEAAALP
jgi:C4-dicarboxylate-specific signal transduction histidine kinase